MFISLRIAVLLFIATKLEPVWTKKVPCGTPLDVAFLIDCSSSLKANQFNVQMSFVENLTKSFDIGPDKTRVAAVTFSDKTNVEFLFNDGKTEDVVKNKVSNIKHKYGSATYTHDGLDTVLKTVFKPGNGERPNYPDVLVLLTDGASTNKYKTFASAKKVKAAEIKIIAIGVGNVNQEELKQIVSEPANDNFFYVKQFSDLNSEQLLDSVGQKTCVLTTTTSTTTTTTTTTTASPPVSTPADVVHPVTDFPNDQPIIDFPKGQPVIECQKKKVDLVFIVDMSTSIWEEYFKQQQQFLADLVDNFDIDSGKTQVGMITFSDDAIVNFYLNTYKNKQDIMNAIKTAEQKGGKTNTHLAFEKYLNDVFTVKNGVRQVAQMCIVITDGQSRNRTATLSMAENLHKRGIIVFTIGVGNMIDQKELENIASKPASKYMQNVTSYAALSAIKEDLAYKACEGPQNDQPYCSDKETEIVFGLFGIGGTMRKLVSNMIINIMQTFDLSKGKVSFGIREGCADAKSALSTDVSSVTSLVTGSSWKELQSTIYKVRNTFKSKTAKKFAVFFLNIDAPDLKLDDVTKELRRLKFSANIAIVGIGEGFTDANLKKLSSETKNLINGDIPVFTTNGLVITEVPVFVKQLNRLLCYKA